MRARTVAERGQPVPIDPAIESWLAEARIPLGSPWIYIGTPERTLSDADTEVILDLTYHHPTVAGAYRSQLHLPQGILGEGWDGYRLELLGVVLELNEAGFELTPPLEIGPLGPRFRVLKQD